ncbi:MAG: hypothetical protein IKD69_11990, partial [Solobacterium sp.]|nr:hypothetical protein [Solobacterium sp.]
DDMVYAPGYGTSLDGIQSWAASNNINLHYTYLTTDDHELAGTIELLDGQWSIYGSLVRKGSTFDVVVYSANE